MDSRYIPRRNESDRTKKRRLKRREKIDKMQADFDYKAGRTHKLTWELVHKMRDMYRKGELSTHKLAKIFGVSQMQCWRIVNYRNWIVDTRFPSVNDATKISEKKRGKRTWKRLDRGPSID